ncbi:acyl-CoA thioesterase [Antarcticibacterium flavum]|uniref:Acyl-CoA thioesterase n=1 Tax=Antarcticibacterium flavum TaxID=2058175 RepID=A0A5B7WY46_9FLAO|nr:MULTISPECIES: thioesterase family protein [Antarcticibacterium]MCM4158822.1 4-hydroxybenzoyl-CoA thioesterase [Antarcticibacterium sp. W02-3]QCY68086.1 acyl-CoA thioesterase [Antarcticibacterium flavum]
MHTLSSVTHFRVRFRECDPLQIVWHGNYLKYFEDAREEFCKEHGFSYYDVRVRGYATPIVKSLCEHKLPLRYSDKFEVEVSFIPTPAAKMIFNYKVTSQNKLVATGETVQVFLDKKGELVLSNPPFFYEWKQKMGIE